MFVVAQISDVIVVEPRHLPKSAHIIREERKAAYEREECNSPIVADLEVLEIQRKALEDHIGRLVKERYIDKVVLDVGLVVAFLSFDRIGDARITEGNTAFKLQFSVAAFSPFEGEVIQGTLKASDPSGLYISLDFFNDIKIPPSLLAQPSVWVPERSTWTWRFENETDLDYVVGSPIRFRVTDVIYNKPSQLEKQMTTGVRSIFTRSASSVSKASPEGESKAGTGSGEKEGKEGVGDGTSGGEESSAMVVLGSVNGDGLGITSWWD